MGGGRTVEIAERLALPIAERLNYELVDVEYKKEGPNWILRFYIDKPGGVGLDDCQLFSNEIGDVLDREDPIARQYYLEVSSPGLDRPLKKASDFERFKGREIEIRLYRAIENRKRYTGELLGLKDNKILIEVDGQEFEFDREDVSMARLVINI